MKLPEPLLLLRGSLRYAALDRVAHACMSVANRHPAARLDRHGLFRDPNVVYGPTRRKEHRLDVYVPTKHGSGPHPVVMYVHGGGFAMCSKDTHRVMAVQIARRGYVVFNINYRQGFQNPFPAPLEDAADALLWVKAHAHRYGGDVSRLAIAGESAGGNLVSALGILHGVKRPETFARRVYDADLNLRAVLATYPYADLTDFDLYDKHPTLPGWARGMLAEARRAYLGRAGRRRSLELASPLALLEQHADAHRIPPFFLSCGTRDPLLRDSKRLKAALDRLGVPCELMVAEGEIHGFDALLWRPAARAKWKQAHAFLAEQMGGPAREDAHAAAAPRA